MRYLVAFMSVCASIAAFSLALAAPEQQLSYSIKRMFVDGPYGQIHLRVAKPNADTNKTPLILFHASPYSGHYFLPFIDEMASDRMVIAIDTPGYGDSAPPPEPLTIAEYANAAIEAIAALDEGLLNGAAVDILGYHTGALIAAEVAIESPDKVRRLVLPGVPYLTGKERKEAYKKYVKPEALSEDGTHLADKWAFATYAMSVGVSLERAQEHFNDAMQCHPRCWWSYHGVFSYEGENRLPLIEQSVLFISYDGSLNDETKAAHKMVGHADHVHISGITRGAFDVAPDKIAAETRAFLDAPRDD